MDSLLNRYRSITFLLVMLVAQMILLAYTVKNPDGVRLIRLWAVTLVTPIAQVAETTRSTVYGVFHNYFDLRDARAQNRRIQAERDQLKLENLYLKSELGTADRVKALAAFQVRSPSKYVAARIILTATTSASKIVVLDRGSNSEVEKGMAVITPDGIVGKIIDAFPTASQALLVTDPEFAAGVVSQKNHVKGILHGAGSGKPGRLRRFYRHRHHRRHDNPQPAARHHWLLLGLDAGGSYHARSVLPENVGPRPNILCSFGR